MICNKCGGENNNGEKYCKYCRNQLVDNNVNNNYSNTGFVYNSSDPDDNSGLNKIMNPTFPIKRFISLIVVIIIVVIGYVVIKNNGKEKGPINGEWLCSSSYGFEKKDASTIIKFNKNGKFTFAKYNDENKNYYKGTYTSKKLDKTNESKTATYYSADIELKDSKLDGQKNEDFSKTFTYEIALNNEKDDNGEITAVIANSGTSSLMYCYKK